VLALKPYGNAQECLRFKTKKPHDRGKKNKDCFTTKNTNHTNMKQEKGSPAPEPLRVSTPGRVEHQLDHTHKYRAGV
jgi:hypothetical protein